MGITRKLVFSFCLLSVLSSVAVTPALAQKGTNVQRRVNFARGRSSATVKGHIADRLTTHEYLLGASAGQTLTVRLSSARKDVNICVVYPSGEPPTHACGRSFSDSLPVDGDYSIIVDSKRENASYSIFVSIR
jgi:hypothetical protein